MDNPSLHSVRATILLIMRDAHHKKLRLHPKLFGVSVVKAMTHSFCCQAHAIDSYNEAMGALISDGLFSTDDGVMALTPLGKKVADEIASVYDADVNPKLLN